MLSLSGCFVDSEGKYIHVRRQKVVVIHYDVMGEKWALNREIPKNVYTLMVYLLI